MEKFTCAELRMEDADGEHLLSAQLQPNPVHQGDVGYYLKVKDFLDLEDPVTDK